MKKKKHLSIRFEDPILLAKFRYVCKSEERSANGQVLIYIRKTVAAYEKVNGLIEKSEYSLFMDDNEV